MGRRWLFLIHRWVGIATCLLLAMWFGSGLVMMYVPFPSLTPAERLQGLSPIDWSRVGAVPAQAVALEQGVDGPVWRLDKTTRAAATGLPEPTVDKTMAARIAAAFGHAPVRAVEPIRDDQWTVAGGYNRYRPLLKVSLDTPDERILYVASTTGEVVLDTDGRERLWNWLGSIPHWIYPTILRRDQPLWRQVILWTSGLAIIGSVSGMWIGILRARFRRRYKGGRITPYRGWQWWHHVIGLAGGTMLMTWIVSGWLSVDPNRWFAHAGISEPARAAYARAAVAPAIDWRRLGAMPEAAGVERLRPIWVDGELLLVLARAGRPPAVLDAHSLMPVMLDADRLVAAASRLVPQAHVASVTTLTAPDAYWYDTKGAVELPVLRLVFDDPARTWVHISPHTGEVLSDLDGGARLYRWLFDALHCWDFRGLIDRRPLWDIWMWFWSLAGLAISVSGVVIGWRRLRPTHAMPRARHV
jgi:hypothetical protein